MGIRASLALENFFDDLGVPDARADRPAAHEALDDPGEPTMWAGSRLSVSSTSAVAPAPFGRSRSWASTAAAPGYRTFKP